MYKKQVEDNFEECGRYEKHSIPCRYSYVSVLVKVPNDFDKLHRFEEKDFDSENNRVREEVKDELPNFEVEKVKVKHEKTHVMGVYKTTDFCYKSDRYTRQKVEDEMPWRYDAPTKYMTVKDWEKREVSE